MSRTAADRAAEHQLSLYLDHIVALVGDGFREEAKSVIVANEARAANRVAEAMREAVLSICREWSANGFLQARLVARDVRDLPLPDSTPDPREATIARLSAELDAAREAMRRADAAINALLIMGDTTKPQKLDETLCWIHNDDLAKSMANDARAVLAKLAKGE